LALLETGFFLGMLIGSLFVMKTKIKRAGIAFSLFLVISAITIIPMGFVYSTFVFWLLNFFCGIFIPFASVPINTLIQVLTPDAFRGRVNSCLSMMSAAAMPLGMGLSGFLMDLMGIEGIFIYMGVGFGVSAIFPLIFRAYRHATLPEAAAEQVLPEESKPLKEAAGHTSH
jgi:MFS family permease